MMKVSDICAYMEKLTPKPLAEAWDNTGFLAGESEQPCRRVMTCLTVTPETVSEAVERHADMIIAHHPTPFRALKELTDATTAGRLLRTLIKNDIALYSPHTRFDSASRWGINQQLADALGLECVTPFVQNSECGGGTGRMGVYPEALTLNAFLAKVRSLFRLPYVQYVGNPDAPVRKVGIGCGAAGEFLSYAIQNRCDVFLTGETNFHTCLEAKAQHVGLVLMTHFAGEKYACNVLAEHLREELPELECVWACENEQEPLKTFF